MTRYWVGVASRDHVRAAVRGGFCQLNHGREAPLKRLQAGDKIMYYSPRDMMGAGRPVQAFTAIGEVGDEDIYAVSVSPTFQPFRRKVRYAPSVDTRIAPLLPHLSFAGEHTGWGMILRRGVFTITAGDYALIADAMRVDPPSMTTWAR